MPSRSKSRPVYVFESILTSDKAVDMRPLERLWNSGNRCFYVKENTTTPLTPEFFEPLLESITLFTSSRSILWVFLRCIPEPSDNDESREVALSTFRKEFSASQTRFSMEQVLDYYLDYERPYYYPQHLTPDWIQRAGMMADRFFHKLKRLWRIYPKVNRTKNVSQETDFLFHYTNPGRRARGEVRTVDLEVFRAESGQEIEGACEMRQSWKYNELKPRFYYAQGGRDYFASRYIKPIAVALMDSIPSSEVKTRIDPMANIECDPDDYIVAWDLTAFTSTLHELRFFLYWMARRIKDLGDVKLELVDYKDGLVYKKASDLILEYNETVNINSPFSVHRIIQKYGLEDFDSPDFEQQNSGMLGVAGNIGFSTALHGYTIESVSTKGKNVCVGDDALSCRPEDPMLYIFPQVQKIGTLHLDKTQIILPDDYGPMKFIKRGLIRTDFGFHIDFLLKLPLPVFVDKRYGGRTPPDNTREELAYKVATTIGQLVWSLSDHWDMMHNHDLPLLTEFLSPFYRYFGLKRGGSLPHPGSKMKIEGREYPMTFAYPPIVFDERFSPYQTDWLEFLLDEAQDSFMIPVFGTDFKPELPDPGDYFFAVQDKGWRMLEDLGIIHEKGMLKEAVSKLEGENKRRYLEYVHGMNTDRRPLYEYYVLKDVPEVFCFLYAPLPRVHYEFVMDGI